MDDSAFSPLNQLSLFVFKLSSKRLTEEQWLEIQKSNNDLFFQKRNPKAMSQVLHVTSFLWFNILVRAYNQIRLCLGKKIYFYNS